MGQTNQDEPQLYDERVLGFGDFIQQLHDNELQDCLAQPQMTRDESMIVVVDKYSISTVRFMRRARSENISKARSFFFYCTVRHFAYTGTATARHLRIGSSSVSRAAEKGERLIQTEAELSYWIAPLKH